MNRFCFICLLVPFCFFSIGINKLLLCDLAFVFYVLKQASLPPNKTKQQTKNVDGEWAHELEQEPGC